MLSDYLSYIGLNVVLVGLHTAMVVLPLGQHIPIEKYLSQIKDVEVNSDVTAPCEEIINCIPQSSHAYQKDGAENQPQDQVMGKATVINEIAEEISMKDNVDDNSKSDNEFYKASKEDKREIEIDSNPDKKQVDINSSINQYRGRYSKSTLIQIEELCVIARQRSEDIAKSFSHDGFESRISEISYQAAAENIWYGDPFSVSGTIQGWNDSQGHKQNMLGDWLSGCGAVRDGYAVFLFMR